MNAVSVIFPYRLQGVWSSITGLEREPFISGTGKILDVLTENILAGGSKSESALDHQGRVEIQLCVQSTFDVFCNSKAVLLAFEK
jgi:hypothetical protein